MEKSEFLCWIFVIERIANASLPYSEAVALAALCNSPHWLKT
jgi:hypothetical protein